MGDDHTLHPMWAEQVLLERGMLLKGADLFRQREAELAKNRQMTSLTPIRSLVTEWIPVVVRGIREYLVNHKKSRGVTPLAVNYLDQCDPYVAALITLRAILDGVTVERTRVTGLAIEIGETIEHELQVRKWESAGKLDRELFQSIQGMLERDHATPGHRARVNINRFNHHLKAGKFGFDWEKWPHEVHFRVGVALIDIVVLNTGWLAYEDDPSGATGRSKWNRVPLVLVPKPELILRLGTAFEHAEMLSPALKPTLMPPKRWEGIRKGGYYTDYVVTPRLIRFKASQENQKEQAADEYEALDMEREYAAIHALQEVPWKVNSRILAVARQAWIMDEGIGKLPRIDTEDLPIRSGQHEAHMALRAAAKAAKQPYPEPTPELALEMRDWRRKAKKVNARNARKASQVGLFKTTIELAVEFEGKKFYFPHNLDFRGRKYPIPPALQPQGSDLSRGLLDYAEGKPIGEFGGWWLAVSVANNWGNDKISMGTRVAWVEEHDADWQAIAADPLGKGLKVTVKGKTWSDCGEPWQALAAIFEYVDAMAQGESYVTHRAVMEDGTCNGIQHLSAMRRDPVAGALVNLVPGSEPQDIYREVADRLLPVVQRIAATGGEPAAHAQYWLNLTGGTFGRDLAKKPTMILPYGGSKEARYNAIMEWVNEADPMDDDATREEWTERAKQVGFLSTHMGDVLKEVVSGGMEVMEWLVRCAKAVTEGDQPIFWVTPSGMVVRHFYGKMAAKQVKLRLNRTVVQLQVVEFTKELDIQSQLRGIPPNFTHSIDACCLTKTINKCSEVGITAITAIHDAYGTLAPDMSMLHVLIREAFVETHREDILGIFWNACRRVLVDLLVSQGMDELDAVTKAEAKLPKMLPRGDLDIEGVLTSDYFFA